MSIPEKLTLEDIIKFCKLNTVPFATLNNKERKWVANIENAILRRYNSHDDLLTALEYGRNPKSRFKTFQIMADKAITKAKS